MKYENQSVTYQIDGVYNRVLISLSPIVIVGVTLLLLGSDVYNPAFQMLIAFYGFVGIGWLAAPGIGLAAGIHPIWVIVFLVFISSQSSLIISSGYPFIEKIPLLGKYAKKIRKKAENLIEKKEYVRNVEYLGIFWLRFLPIYGTGPNVMTLVGMMLGLNWKKVWLTITLSALTRFSMVTLLLYYGYINI